MPDARPRRHHLNPRVLGHARGMRREPAPAERKLWWGLRDRRLSGFKFRRQQVVGPFVADFYCARCRLIIELDGDTHAARAADDARRTAWLARNGHEVVRFVNDDVHHNLTGVLGAILAACGRRSDARGPADNEYSPAHSAAPLLPLPSAGEGRGEGERQESDRDDRHHASARQQITPPPVSNLRNLRNLCSCLLSSCSVPPCGAKNIGRRNMDYADFAD